ncbi:PQQ-binding-like beta-propeller repeat protein [Deltaproteobacteria bacterium TL4]
MKHFGRYTLYFIGICIFFVGENGAFAQKKLFSISWKDLQLLDYQTGEMAPSLKEMENQTVELPGYAVPLSGDRPDNIKEFLFVPTPGACIHTPPPPPNQIVYTHMDKEVTLPMFTPLLLTGKLSVVKTSTSLAEASFAIEGKKIEPYKPQRQKREKEDQPRKIRWRFNSCVVKASPIVHQDTLYLPGCSLYALNPKTGVQRWKFRPDSTPKEAVVVAGTPAADDARVYFGSFDSHLYAVDSQTGKLQWSFKTSAPIESSPVIIGQHLYFGSNNGTLYALKRNTGRVQWSFQTETSILTQPTSNQDLIYFRNRGKELYALDRLTGKKRWMIQTKRGFRSPVVQDNFLYLDTGNAITAVDGLSGKELWSFEGNLVTVPLLMGKSLFFGDWDALYLLDSETGKLQWQLQKQFMIEDITFAYKDVAYFTSKNLLFALNVRDQMNWKFSIYGNIVRPPYIYQDTAFLGSDDNHLYAIDISETLK